MVISELRGKLRTWLLSLGNVSSKVSSSFLWACYVPESVLVHLSAQWTLETICTVVLVNNPSSDPKARPGFDSTSNIFQEYHLVGSAGIFKL